MSVISPDRREFHRLAADWTVVPVWRELVADLTTPVAAFVRTVGDEPGFLLESVEHGERWSRFSFIGRRPLGTLVARGNDVSATGEFPDGTPLDQGILTAIEHIFVAMAIPDHGRSASAARRAGGLSGLRRG